ncbi:MAG: single-stranded-DNA-specific exonuclease RecJ [Lachnospiraceae bacterium]|nr:single-stranded-DNA-specific exonuclease RecJ [Lachnospiraceae bacterium]
MADWFLIRKGGDYSALGEQYHISPVLARLLKNRGIEGEEAVKAYLHGGEECLHDPLLLKDMDRCGAVLLEAIREGKQIRVIGDYDIDGVCSTAILLRGIRALGGKVDAQIPHRVRDGYGMNCEMIRSAREAGVDVILTCDNGIAAMEEARLAAEYGITLLITDHHEVPYEEKEGERRYLLPPAAAVVDPKREDDSYPFPGICGGFIAYKLILSLFRDQAKRELSTDLKEGLLQLAAFATVGDIMELKDENRALVKLGLKLMQERPASGIRELLLSLGIDGAVSAYHLGFMLGPCVNATGRIDTAERALELFVTEDREQALKIAAELKELNESRKSMTEACCAEAVAQIEAGEHKDCRVFVIFLPDCHESVAGIIAGRIRERYERPVLIVTRAEEGLKGSARSVPAYHMYDALSRVSDIFTRFGGHAQAAGFSLPEEKLGDLRKRLNENCTLTEEDFRSKIRIDLELKLHAANGELVDEMRLLEPCGNGNPSAVLARRGLLLKRIRPIGAEAKLCILQVEDEGREYELKLFRRTEEIKAFMREKYGEDTLDRLLKGRGEGVPFAVIFTPQWNEYRGEKNLQLVVEDYKS